MEKQEVGGWTPNNQCQDHCSSSSSSNKENNGVDRAASSEVDPELVKQFFISAKASLLNNLDRVVKPVPDDMYSDYVDQFHFILENKWPLTEEEEDDDENGDDDDDYEDPEIDEEELIDASAWLDARELRSRVRGKAARVQQLRERVLNGTTNIVNKTCLQPHISDVKPEIIKGEENESEGGAATIVGNVDESLKALSALLEDTKWKQFPDRIQSLQDTIEVIRKDFAPNRVFSQTELAITGGRRDFIGADGINEDASAAAERYIEYNDPMDDIMAQANKMKVEEKADSIVFDPMHQQDDESDVDGREADKDKENSTTPMDAVDRLALFGQMFS
jgi:hypothetical protein